MYHRKKRSRRSNSFTPPNNTDILETPKRPILKEAKKLKLDPKPTSDISNSTIVEGEVSSINTENIMDIRKSIDNDEQTNTNSFADMQDKETCKCNRRVKSDQNSIMCDLCEFWFHTNCVAISNSQFKKISEIGETMKWFCNNCEEEVKNMINNSKFLKYQNLEFKKQNQMFKNKFIKLEHEISELNLKLSEFEKDLQQNMNDEISARVLAISGQLDENYKKTTNDNKMFHGKVTRLEKDYNEMKRNILMSNNNVQNSSNKKDKDDMIEKNQKLQSRIADIEQKLESTTLLQTSLNSNDKQLTDIKNQIESKIENKIKENIVKTMRDEDTRKNRQNNLIFFNMEESSQEKSEDRENEDYNNVADLISYGVRVSNFTIMKTIRLGKRDGNNQKPRPLLVKLASSNEKMDIISNAKNLKYANEKSRIVGIMRDLDEEDRKIEKKLYEELKKKRDQGEFGWFIQKGKLCRQQNFPRTR